MSGFALHPRLAADTHFVADWSLSRLLLMKDARYPWLILVPRRAGFAEFADLSAADRTLMMEEIVRAGAAVGQLLAGAKLNVAALGNNVSQLHVHVVGRQPGDPAWPGPVWGHSPAVAYDPAVLQERLAKVRHC